MFSIRRRLSQFLIVLLVLAVFTTLSISLTVAQTPASIAYGSVTQGNVPSDNAQAMYSFNGAAGDLVSIQAIGLSPTWQPIITLFNPAQQMVAASTDNQSPGFMTTNAQIVYRLQETGSYTILVSGTAGDFLLSLGARLAISSTPLVLNTPFNLNLPTTDVASALVFNTDPTFATTLLIDANPVDLNANIEIRNGVGQIVTVLHGNLDNACISFGPGDEVDEMTVISSPDTTGTISVTLSNAPCQLGAEAAQPQPAPVQFVPVPIEGVCAASSFRNVNIRSGPSTAFGIVSTLPSRQPIQVVGRIDDGSWYAVQSTFVQGWISAGVVSVTGPCDALPVVPPPTPPPASPTPGLPVITVVVTATELTASPTVDPSLPTATETPTETVMPTETAPEPTAEVTPTVTPG